MKPANKKNNRQTSAAFLWYVQVKGTIFDVTAFSKGPNAFFGFLLGNIFVEHVLIIIVNKWLQMTL